MIARPASLSCVVIALLLAAPTLARADAAGGEQLASRWCVACHIIGAGSPATVQQGPPSFRSIAQSGMTAEQLRTFLTRPHGPMPDLSLTRSEIDDLIAYIETLH